MQDPFGNTLRIGGIMAIASIETKQLQQRSICHLTTSNALAAAAAAATEPDSAALLKAKAVREWNHFHMLETAISSRLARRGTLDQLLTELAVFFNDSTVATLGLNHRRISDETYGMDSRVYVRCDDLEQRLVLEGRLSRAGLFEVSPDYWPGAPIVDVGVAYFKGWHWDE
jgi:hypothetical protein